MSGPTVRLVVPVRIEDQLPDQLAVLGDDPHAKAIDEREHPGAGEASHAHLANRDTFRPHARDQGPGARVWLNASSVPPGR